VRLYLVRHAEPDESVRGRCCGRTDVPLSAAGLASARRLAAAFAGLDVAAVYSSSLRRAVDTAAPLAAALGSRVTCHDALAEIDFGELEGRTFDEVALSHPDLYERWMSAPAAVRFPGGESYADVRARAVAVATEIVRRHRDASAIAVAHGGPIRAIVAAALEMPDRAVFRLDVRYGSVTLIEWIGDTPVLRALNREGPPTPTAGA
jgi:broad specificity phosphatase PhoE